MNMRAPKMEYLHLRYEDPYNPLYVSNMGGVTIAYEFSEPPTPEGDSELRIGISVCSTQDNFCRKEGRTKAAARCKGISKLWSHQSLLTKEEVANITVADIVLTCCDIWPQYLSTWQGAWEDVSDQEDLDEMFEIACEQKQYNGPKHAQEQTCEDMPHPRAS